MSKFTASGCHTFLFRFWHFQMAVSQWKLAWLTPNLGILWISVCSFWLFESIVANPIIYRFVPRPSRFEIKQCVSCNGWWERGKLSCPACYHFVTTEDCVPVQWPVWVCRDLFCQQVSDEMCFTSSTGQPTSLDTFILVTKTWTVPGNKRWRILGSSSAKENLPG